MSDLMWGLLIGALVGLSIGLVAWGMVCSHQTVSAARRFFEAVAAAIRNGE